MAASEAVLIESMLLLALLQLHQLLSQQQPGSVLQPYPVWRWLCFAPWPIHTCLLIAKLCQRCMGLHQAQAVLHGDAFLAPCAALLLASAPASWEVHIGLVPLLMRLLELLDWLVAAADATGDGELVSLPAGATPAGSATCTAIPMATKLGVTVRWAGAVTAAGAEAEVLLKLLQDVLPLERPPGRSSCGRGSSATLNHPYQLCHMRHYCSKSCTRNSTAGASGIVSAGGCCMPTIDCTQHQLQQPKVEAEIISC